MALVDQRRARKSVHEAAAASDFCALYFQLTLLGGGKWMRSFAITAILLTSSVAFADERPLMFGQLNVESQKSLDSGMVRSPSEFDKVPEPMVVLESKSNKYGSYNIADGTQGPFWSAQGIWNAATKKYTGLKIAAGSTKVSGFLDTAGLLPGMAVGMTPDAMPENTIVVSVEASSIVVSNPATKNGTGEDAIFGFVNDGVMFNQVITNHPDTFPRGTGIEWSYPGERNNASVYSYAIIAGYGIGSGGYFRPLNKPAPKKVSEFNDLSVTYDLTVAGGRDDFAVLVETFPTTASDPSPPDVTNTMTNEIGFLPHAPDYLWAYILTLSDHFDYSSSDGTFHAYIATRAGNVFTNTPSYTMIVPVTEAGGRTPRDMMLGKQTLPLLGVFRELVARGIMPSDSYVCGFDFGFEIGRNSGHAILNDIAWKWQ